ncbi:MAG: hypothetical protein KGI89_05370 [Euryarchaeota archaeon]|nr:hypothetical protein [Euryarchaeota archaeon]
MTGTGERWEVAAKVAVLCSIALAVVASLLALGVTAAGGFDCRAYPSCLFEQPSWSVQAHVLVGALLGVVLLVLAVLGFLLRRTHPGSFPATFASFLLSIVMGGIGAGLSTGALPDAFLLVQSALVVLLLALLLFAHRKLRRANAPAARAPDGGVREAAPPVA